MGTALRGKKEGDKVQVRAPNRRYELTIKTVA
jgi:transcription elongation GreA/GreB family factor